jgi:isopenicillin N synthase-like dioxygenase
MFVIIRLIIVVLGAHLCLLTAEFEIPIIDFSSFRSSNETSQRKQIADKIGDACINVGFFVITGHGVSDEVLQNAC